MRWLEARTGCPRSVSDRAVDSGEWAVDANRAFPASRMARKIESVRSGDSPRSFAHSLARASTRAS